MYVIEGEHLHILDLLLAAAKEKTEKAPVSWLGHGEGDRSDE